jgi:hypothetical protein
VVAAFGVSVGLALFVETALVLDAAVFGAVASFPVLGVATGAGRADSVLLAVGSTGTGTAVAGGGAGSTATVAAADGAGSAAGSFFLHARAALSTRAKQSGVVKSNRM